MSVRRLPLLAAAIWLAAPGSVGATAGARVGADACSSHTPAFTGAAGRLREQLTGFVRSGSRPLASMPVALYRTSSSGGRAPVRLGGSVTGPSGSFRLVYTRQPPSRDVFYLLAGRRPTVRLAAVLGVGRARCSVVANERTTVAMGFAMAQFIAGSRVGGPAPGLQNAAAMTGNLAAMRTGSLSSVIQSSPNGNRTSTLRTFNTLANMLAGCVRSGRSCATLFRLARPPRNPAPRGTLAAAADIARNPWHNIGALFALARRAPGVYQPALRSGDKPAGWILALRFDGDGRSLSGPGNMAIDAQGNVWVTSNYVYSRNPRAPVCGSRMLFKFTPTGRYVPGSPYTGGGLNGAGFGITLDPRGNVWVGNFGFAAAKCPDQPPHASVSEFTAAGRPLSPAPTSNSPGGFTEGPISWPQGTISDRSGNIWIANCGNDTVTRYPAGNPRAFASYGRLGIQEPFDDAVNLSGQLFVTGNASNSVAMLNPDGTPTIRSPITGGGLSAPLGIAADSHGNMWVSNSGRVRIPCPSTAAVNGTPSVTFIGSGGTVGPQPFTGGGISLPWGIAVDGNDNVWVANFGGRRITELCGVNPASCPPGVRTGGGISPARTGYGFDGLARNTGIQIDPSGNVWIANNWKQFPIPDANPGGYQMVVVLGAAGPLRTPLIGPPVRSR